MNCKKIAIMQPYFLPYIGYFQLINAVDTFVIADDLNYMKNSYINRNIILENGKKYKFTLQLKGASQNKHINNIEVGDNTNVLLNTFKHNYKKAPYFKDIYILLEQILNNDEKNLARFIGFSLKIICEYLEISTKLIYSSELEKDNSLKFDDRIFDICHNQNSFNYINPIGGYELYNKENFTKKKIKLDFLEMNDIKYSQFSENFICCLSMIDVLMFNSKEEIQELLKKYNLV